MTVEDRLGRLETRQEHMISAIHGLTDVMEQTRDRLTEVMAWLQEPPSSDLPDTLATILNAVDAQNSGLQAVLQKLDQLPAEVARAVSTGEVR